MSKNSTYLVDVVDIFDTEEVRIQVAQKAYLKNSHGVAHACSLTFNQVHPTLRLNGLISSLFMSLLSLVALVCIDDLRLVQN